MKLAESSKRTKHQDPVKHQAPRLSQNSRPIVVLAVGVWSFSGGWGLVLGAFAATQASHELKIQIVPRFDGAPLVFDALTNRTASGQRVSVTRLDFLVSDVALRRLDGRWICPTNSFAYVCSRAGRTSFRLNEIPAGRYTDLRFHVGLPASINHKEPIGYPAGHALNPEVNHLHWAWMGGYVFLAVEGHWSGAPPRGGAPAPLESGYSFHLATDRQLMTVELPLDLEFASDCELQLALNVERIVALPHLIELGETNNSTHSRTNDHFATLLRENVENAFSVLSLRQCSLAAETSKSATHVEMAAGATPYRFTMSAFFSQPELPADNPLTEEGVELGRRLFFEPLLSVNNSQSCASCHLPASAFSEQKRVSTGAEGQNGSRNAMALLNLAWKSSFFWDGRAASLRNQVVQPIQNPLEMHEALSNVVKKLAGSQRKEGPSASSETRDRVLEIDQSLLTSAPTGEVDYPALFSRAFGTEEITADRIARALEQFLLVQTSYDSKFDRALRGDAKFTAAEQHGFELFHTEYDPRREQFGADCFHCHGGPLFRSQDFANNGLDAEAADTGRFTVTGRPGDRGKFAVPSLRNVALTAPYMHDGRFATLEAVIEHYATGLKRSGTLDPNLAKHPDSGVPLSATDKQALVAFLKTLTDERFRTKPTDLAGEP